MNSTRRMRPRPRRWIGTKPKRALRSWLAAQPGLVAELARDELAAVADLTEDIKVLAKRIATRVQELNPLLLNIFGCGELTAARVDRRNRCSIAIPQ